jgi:transglutaminase-like putative cysteine protease
MKRFLKLFKIVFVLVIFLVSTINVNYIYAIDEIASGNCGNSITWSLNSSGTLTITGSGAMSGSACAWADYKDKIKEVEFNGNITSISDCAFECNTNIETIILPDSVTSINRRAFAECTNLKNIVFPKNLVSIGTSAFYKCTSLESIDLSENIMYINSYAFAECTSLKSATIRAIYTSIGDYDGTISNTAKIYGYKYSNIFYYARYYGRSFTDLDTNETSTETFTNQSYLDVLPTSNVKALGITSHGSRTFSENKLIGYNTSFCYEKDITNTDYQNIKAKVEELTADCTTEREKAYAIFQWAYNNINYVSAYGASANIDRIYSIFNEKKGNCEVYTMITNYMLYLCDIPTATASNVTHEWSVAFVDGAWIYIDSTQDYFGIIPPNKVNQISFAYDDLVYIIDDPLEGYKVTGTAKTDYIKGDINGDGIVNGNDVNYGMRGIVNKITLTDLEKKIGDVNVDGIFNGNDINMLMRYIVGKIDKL